MRELIITLGFSSVRLEIVLKPGPPATQVSNRDEGGDEVLVGVRL